MQIFHSVPFLRPLKTLLADEAEPAANATHAEKVLELTMLNDMNRALSTRKVSSEVGVCRKDREL